MALNYLGTAGSEVPGLEALERLAETLVGAGRVGEAHDCLSRAMLKEALSRTGANYARSALLLGVKRQAVQQMVARFELEAWAAALRRSVERRPTLQPAEPQVSNARR